MDMNEISVFVKVIQAGSFNRAAKQLGMPNSTVSAKVSALEKRLGLTLIHRTTRKLRLTDAGREFFERCSPAISTLKEAEELISQSQDSPQGLLRLTAPVVFSSLLSKVVVHYRARFPQVSLDLVLTDKTVDLIEDNIDLAIRAGSLKDSSFIAKRIGVNYFAPFASAAYLKGREIPRHPRDLDSHECIHYTPINQQGWSLIHRGGNKVKISPQKTVSTDDLNMVKELALNGAGIALLPTFLCRNETREKKLVRILPEWRSEVRPVSFVYPQRRFPTPKVSSFIAIAEEILAEHLRD